jgi:nitroreductase
MQTVMLVLTANGLGSCPKTALGFMANAVRPALNLPDDQKLIFGLSFGYPDWEASVNSAVTDRASASDLIHYHQ